LLRIKFIVISGLLLLYALMTGCSTVQKTNINHKADQFISGTIKYIDLEGGFYGIIAEDGTRFNPENLPEKFRSDGLRVRFNGTPDRKGVSIQMWGMMFRINKIEILK
jgi:hypothetical protein